jgi:hypothetical protein
MTSNFTFAFNRMTPPSAWATAPAPVSRAPVPVSRAPVPVSRAPVPVSRAPDSNAPVTRSNRFSMTRMINFKSSGGCRSCN